MRFFQNFLESDPGLTALVSNRIYPIKASQPKNKPAAFPCVTFIVPDQEYQYQSDGVNPLVKKTVQVDAWALDYDSVQEVSAALKELLNGYAGMMDSVQVLGVFIENEQDTYNAPISGNEGGFHNVQINFSMWVIDN